MTHPIAALLSSEAPAPSPATGLDDGLFSFLDHSHQEMQRMLLALKDVVDAIDMDGLTPPVRARIQEVRGWFNTQAREHHLDEERHVFPALLASAVEATRTVAERLVQDHGWLEEDWIEIEPSLAAAADGYHWFDLGTLRQAVQVFEQLYFDHILLEESLAYPQARRLIPAADLEAMGIEMARRRALRDAQSDNNPA
jgi:hemerythrin-like domain-containing protein